MNRGSVRRNPSSRRASRRLTHAGLRSTLRASLIERRSTMEAHMFKQVIAP
jgi:hypothetical protein